MQAEGKEEKAAEMKRKWKYSCIVAGVTAVAVAAGGIGYRVIAADVEEKGTEMTQPMQETAEENGFSEEGVTQLKTESQLPVFSVGAVTMTVEEVYVEAGSTVEEGDALFRVEEADMEAAISYYEDAVADAGDALYMAQLAFESGVLSAESELESTKLAADDAWDNYEASLSNLTVKVEEAEEDYNDAVTEIWEYQEAIDNGTYYVQVGIDEKQSAVDSAKAQLVSAQEQLAAAQNACEAAKAAMAADLENLKSQIAGGASYEELAAFAEQTAADYATVQAASDTLAESQSAADNAQSNVQRAEQSQESAIKEYNSKVETANQRIAELTEQLEELSEKCEQAKREATTGEPEIEKQYEEAVLEGKYADTEYETTLAALQNAVDDAQDTFDSLTEEQSALLAIEDGIICADRAGTLASVTYEAGDELYDDMAFATYYDTDTILISVEVPQEKIAKLAVGDTVEVTISENRNASTEGKIVSIASEKTAGQSISKVTYAVIISVDNTNGNLGAGSSATVRFDDGEETGGTK